MTHDTATRRYILIDSNSGSVWNEIDAPNPVEACRLTDRKLGDERAEYDEYAGSALLGMELQHYRVYEAPEGWEMPDGAGDESRVIEAVEALPCVATIVYSDDE